MLNEKCLVWYTLAVSLHRGCVLVTLPMYYQYIYIGMCSGEIVIEQQEHFRHFIFPEEAFWNDCNDHDTVQCNFYPSCYKGWQTAPHLSPRTDRTLAIWLFNASVTQIWFKRCFHIQQVHSLCVDSRPVYYIVHEIVSVVFSIV